MSNRLRELARHGQSVWYDSLRRGILVSGELARYIEDDGLTGLTTNPAIYEKAIAGSHDYDAELTELLPRSDLDAKAIYEQLAFHDIQAAADLLRPVYERTGRRDGYVSLEVSPVVARDTGGGRRPSPAPLGGRQRQRDAPLLPSGLSPRRRGPPRGAGGPGRPRRGPLAGGERGELLRVAH